MHMWHVLIPHAVDAAAAAIRRVCAAVRSHVARHGAKAFGSQLRLLSEPVSLRSENGVALHDKCHNAPRNHHENRHVTPNLELSYRLSEPGLTPQKTTSDLS